MSMTMEAAAPVFHLERPEGLFEDEDAGDVGREAWALTAHRVDQVEGLQAHVAQKDQDDSAPGPQRRQHDEPVASPGVQLSSSAASLFSSGIPARAARKLAIA